MTKDCSNKDGWGLKISHSEVCATVVQVATTEESIYTNI